MQNVRIGTLDNDGAVLLGAEIELLLTDAVSADSELLMAGTVATESKLLLDGTVEAELLEKKLVNDTLVAFHFISLYPKK